MAIDADAFALLRSWFDRLAALPAAGRAALWASAEARALAPDLRQQVEAWLAADADTDPSTAPTPIGALRQSWQNTRDQLGQACRRGQYAGAFELIEAIGEGGMGVVWLAERRGGGFVQRVAIKLLGAAAGDSIELQHRFAAERQILARLDHPHIARLIDGGALEDGTPYLAMELVEGERIDHWCARHQADVAARLHLFSKVCHAVLAAHRMLIVHRDLKPGNILVDGHGEPKLLDFGIAKVIGDNPGEETRAGQRLLTPRYAAPEQFEGHSGVGVDVYALGVILYELLTGVSPYGDDTGDGLRLVESIRVREPAAPSRVAPSPALARRLRGDLDAIVLMALRKDPRQRYAGVEELLADLEAHLERRPVRARRGSHAYHLLRYAERNRLPLSLLVALLLGLVSTGIIWRTQRDAVAIERDKAERTTRFLASVLGGVSPERAQGLDRTLMRQVLDDAAARVTGELGDAPEARARIDATIAGTYINLGEAGRAMQLLEGERADLALRLPADARELLRLEADLARARHEAGTLDREPELLATTLQRQLARFGPNDEDVLASATQLVRQRRLAGAVEAARALGQERLASAQATAENAETLEALMVEVATTDSIAGDHDSAIRLHRAAIAARERRSSGGDDVDLMELRGNFCGTLMLAKRYDEALEVANSVLPGYLERYGSEHPRTLVIRNNTAGILLALGRAGEALPITEALLVIRRRVSGERHPETLIALGNVAAAALKAGALARAEETFRAFLPMCDEIRGPAHPSCAERRAGLGKVLRDRGAYAEAESLLLASYEAKLQSEDRHFASAGKVAAELVTLYDAWGKPEMARHWRDKVSD